MKRIADRNFIDFTVYSDALKLDTAGIARLCGVSVRAVQRWKVMDRRVPTSVVRLLGVCEMVKRKYPAAWADAESTFFNED